MIHWGTFCHTQPVQRSLSSASGISITAGMIHCSHKRCCENGRNWKQSFKCCHVYHFPNLTCQPRLMYSPDSYTYSATHLRGPMAPPGIFEQRTHRVESNCHSSWQDQEWRHGGKHQCQDWRRLHHSVDVRDGTSCSTINVIEQLMDYLLRHDAILLNVRLLDAGGSPYYLSFNLRAIYTSATTTTAGRAVASRDLFWFNLYSYINK